MLILIKALSKEIFSAKNLFFFFNQNLILIHNRQMKNLSSLLDHIGHKYWYLWECPCSTIGDLLWAEHMLANAKVLDLSPVSTSQPHNFKLEIDKILCFLFRKTRILPEIEHTKLRTKVSFYCISCLIRITLWISTDGWWASRNYSQYVTRQAQLATSSQLVGDKIVLRILSHDAWLV